MKQRKNLTVEIYSRILKMMINYDLVPGQRLLFTDLARQLGVSRTPVNNALCILAKEGYLDFIPNQGYTVHKLTKEEADGLFEIRQILELGAIGKAIQRITPSKIEYLQKAKQDYEKSIADRVQRELFVLDTNFHTAIIEMGDNPYLVTRYRDLCQRIFLHFRIDALRFVRVREIVKEHNELFEAICIRDVEMAKALIIKHNQCARKSLFSFRKAGLEETDDSDGSVTIQLNDGKVQSNTDGLEFLNAFEKLCVGFQNVADTKFEEIRLLFSPPSGKICQSVQLKEKRD